MRTHEPDPAVPACPACKGRHYPATKGNGARVWCDGSPASARAAMLDGMEQARERARDSLDAQIHEAHNARAALRAESRARSGRPLDAIDAGLFRAALDAL